MEQKSAGVGIFDSGMGGLDVAAAISRLLPKEEIIYFGDNARVPYGTKSAEVVRGYTYEAAERLVQRGVKALVIACNTASAVIDRDHLESQFGVPVFGMIEAGLAACRSYIAPQNSLVSYVTVLATPGTVRSRAYQNLISKHFPQVHISALPCPIFVPLVEMGWEDHSLSARIVEAQLREHMTKLSDVLCRDQRAEAIYLLGCTHYPMMRESIAQGVSLLDSGPFHCIDGAESVAELLKARLEREGLLNDRSDQRVVERVAYFSDDPYRPAASELASRFWRRRGGVGKILIMSATR